jgi:hypothetical protein
MQVTPDRPTICDARARLPLALARTALEWTQKPDHVPTEVQNLRCTLETHAAGDHYAHVIDMAPSTAGWTQWPEGAPRRYSLSCPTAPLPARTKMPAPNTKATPVATPGSWPTPGTPCSNSRTGRGNRARIEVGAAAPGKWGTAAPPTSPRSPKPSTAPLPY